MLRLWSVARLRAEFGALEACAERAGIALASIQRSPEAPMAAEIRACCAAAARALAQMPPWMTSWMHVLARRQATARPRWIVEGARLVIVAVALTAFAALVVLSALAL